MAKKGKPTHPQSLARRKYSRHKAQAKFRNIAFELTFDEWNQWWLSNGVDKNTTTYTKQDTSRPCMCRYNDDGAYNLNNIYFATQVDNTRDRFYTPNWEARHVARLKPIYRWGSELVTLFELKQLAGETVTPYNYHSIRYDHRRQYEGRVLRNRFIRLHGKKRTRTKYHNPQTGEWHSTLTSVTEAMGMDLSTYKKRMNKGVKGYTTKTSPVLEDYVRNNTIYPDPVILEDI